MARDVSKIFRTTLTSMGLITALFFLFLIIGTQDAQAVTKNVNINVIVPGDSVPPSGGGTGDIVFDGKAYPNAFLTILVDGYVNSTFIADSGGFFNHRIRNLRAGLHSFGIFAQDIDGRLSPTLGFSIALIPSSTTTVEELFMPPTIETSGSIKQGSPVVILGQSFPSSEVFLFVEPGNMVKSAIANAQGKWVIILPASDFGLGEYTAKVRAITEGGQQSEFSQEISFEIVEELPPDQIPPDEIPETPLSCPLGDLNQDGFVNIVDISIWVFYLNTDNTCADQNKDGIVDIFDLSIIVFYWK